MVLSAKQHMTVTSDCATASQVQRGDRTALEQAVPPGELGVSQGLAGPAASLCFGSLVGIAGALGWNIY